MKQHIPKGLIYFRLIAGLMIVLLSLLHVPYYTTIAILLLALGLLSDILDGIIARQLHISTQALRRLDSAVDQVFFIVVSVATYIQCPGFFNENAVWLIVLLSFEALTYLVSFFKFRKEIATHTIGAKLWTLFVFATLIQLITTCNSELLFIICFWTGIITRIEIIAIILAIKNWTNDIPTFYHAIQLRNNKVIKRHKMFNG